MAERLITQDYGLPETPMMQKLRKQGQAELVLRHTVNDILIFASALDKFTTLVTEDNLLNRFAANYFGAPLDTGNDLLEIDFQHKLITERQHNQESKGCINRRWQFAFKSHRNPR